MPVTRRAVLHTLAGTAAAAAFGAHTSLSETEAPLDGHDPLRPSFHYLPARNWMNDPCAPIFYRGQYHLFHQFNPHAAVWGDMHWAHATSPDMVHWTRRPFAIAPTPGGPDSEGVFTGSSLLHNGTPAVIYTGVQTVPPAEATISDGVHSFRETQLLATAASADLSAWTKRPQPVIPAPPPGLKVTGFRDPTPFEHAGNLYLVVGSGVFGVGGMALLYRARKLAGAAPDLTRWEYLHPLIEDTAWTPPTAPKPSKDPVDTGEMWECPDFFALDGRHVLIYSTRRITLWQVGDLDPATLRFHPTAAGRLDLGRSFYAPKTQLDNSGNRILWGWLNETRPEAEFAAAGWSGMLSLPRVLNIRNGRLAMSPLPAIQSLRVPHSDNLLNAQSGPNILLSSSRPVHEFTAILQQNSRPDIPTNLLLSDHAGPLLAIRSVGSKGVVLGAPNDLWIPLDANLPASSPLHVFFDNSVLELFLGDTLCFTHRFYRRDPSTPIANLVLHDSRSVIDPHSFSLQPIWPT